MRGGPLEMDCVVVCTCSSLLLKSDGTVFRSGCSSVETHRLLFPLIYCPWAFILNIGVAG